MLVSGSIALVSKPLRNMLCDIIPKTFRESWKSPGFAAWPAGFVPTLTGRFSDVFDFLPRLAACGRDGFGEKLGIGC
jgi:hypothetical protein